jgi:di/tricarboxylate transporter
VLAFRSRGELIRERLDRIRIRVGDTLLVQAAADSIDRLSRNRDFIVGHEPERPSYRTNKIPHAVAIIAGVVALPAMGMVPIVVSALAGVAAMVVTGVLKPTEIYDSVDWNVIFLLAGVIPLGIALEQTGAAALIGQAVAASADVLPALGVLWVFYVVTALVTNVISNNASVVLMIPVAIEASNQLGANAFAFVLAVTFAASTAFMTPVGYQTNLFVYGPGGYKFADYFRVGAPLQFLLSLVTVGGIAVFWGLG